ncbi:MAG: O-antigen ligase family protein, partial [Deltaproteobacteria bacterium]|nr:O-antigen ligase family protein [Deltaproteobacteria bacterium]
FLALSAMAALALALWEENLQRRVMLLAATAFCGLGVTLTLSRGAMGALAFGMVVMVAVATRWRRDRDHRDAWSPQGGMLYVPLALALVLALAAWLAYEPVLKELGAMVPEGQNLAKLELWPSGLAMLKANPLVGVGRGAFATAFPRYLSGDLPGAITFSHLENQYLHLPIELGLPIGGGVIIASFLAWLIWLRNTKHEGSALAFVVILPMVAAHNLVDFNLELLGIALPLAIIAGALSAASTATLHRHRHNRHTDNADTADTSRPRHRRLTTRRIFLALAPALTLGLAVAVPLITPTVPLLASQGGADLLTQIKSQKTADAVRRVLAPAIAAHPADCLPQIFGARALFRLHDRRAIRWVNRALYLCPRSDLAHAEAAQILDAFGHRSQALGECRQALANSSPSHERRLLVWCLARAARIEDVNAALPQRPIVYTHAIGTLLGRRRPKLAAAVAEAAHKRWPAAPHLALTTLSALQAAKRWPDAEALGQKLLKVQASPRLYALHARSLRSSSLASAIEILHEGVRRYPRDLGLRIALVTTLLGPKDKAPALREAAALMPMTRSRNDQIRVHRLLARVYRENGRPHRARYEAQQAAKLLKH